MTWQEECTDKERSSKGGTGAGRGNKKRRCTDTLEEPLDLTDVAYPDLKNHHTFRSSPRHVVCAERFASQPPQLSPANKREIAGFCFMDIEPRGICFLLLSEEKLGISVAHVVSYLKACYDDRCTHLLS